METTTTDTASKWFQGKASTKGGGFWIRAFDAATGAELTWISFTRKTTKQVDAWKAKVVKQHAARTVTFTVAVR